LEFQTALKIIKDNESAERSAAGKMQQQRPPFEKMKKLDDKLVLNITHTDGMHPDP